MVDFILNDEQQEYQKLAREFSQRHLCGNAHQFDIAAQPAPDLLRQAWESGLVNVQVPDAFGGLGLGCWDAVVIAEELSFGCAGICAPIESNLLATLPLLRFASDSLKSKVLTPLMEEVSFIGCPGDMFCQRYEPALSASKEGSEYVLNGTIESLANGLCRWFVVPVAMRSGVSFLLIPHDAKGLDLNEKPYQLGRRAADIRTAIFKDVRIAQENLIGTENGGTQILTDIRSSAYVLLAAGSVGIARCGLENAVRYAKERHTFGQPIANHQGIAFILADMAKDIQAARLLTWQAAAAIDQGLIASEYAATARSFAQNTAMRVTTDAVQVYGGYGYSKEYPVEKLMRDAKMYQLSNGTAAELHARLGHDLLLSASR